MKKLLGSFPIGYENIELYVDWAGDGASGELPDDSKPVGKITIGLLDANWRLVVESALHESFEYLSVRHKAHYSPSHFVGDYPGRYTFTFNHQTFQEICAQQADFLVKALPVLAQEYKAFQRAQKRK